MRPLDQEPESDAGVQVMLECLDLRPLLGEADLLVPVHDHKPVSEDAGNVVMRAIASSTAPSLRQS